METIPQIEQRCPNCHGQGKINDEKCATCNGIGTVLTEAGLKLLRFLKDSIRISEH